MSDFKLYSGGMKWRMTSPCADCPFNAKGPGLHLRRSLGGARWDEILDGLLNDRHFTCHKTSDETGDGSNLICAGAIAWQEKRGLNSNLQRVMERVEYIFRSRRKEV